MNEKNTTTHKRTYRKSSETQKIIFDVAISLMSEKGFQGTTIRDICSAAKIPVGSFYNCYKSKVDILRDIYDRGDKLISEEMTSFGSLHSAREKILRFSLSYAKLNEDTGIEVMKVLFYPENQWFATERPMQKLVYDIVVLAQQSGELRKDISANDIVCFLFDILRGICYSWCIYNGEFSLRERMTNHVSLFCDAILA